jgi:hypothetical protein
MEKPKRYPLKVTVNGHKIAAVLIGRHYLVKHAKSMNDELILRLVTALDGGRFPIDSSSDDTDYYTADILLEETGKMYRVIWLFEGKFLEILGVVNAYRRKSKRK